ncbi:hypothetical protein PITCH_A1610006 [uncultured Desulfobacterium sp.]|uniref:Uncharacterized protein n=1 Tax=uncultured Desulfobacterium sp. TaxID=201089 RepID=A0A445MU08_9BACT|nr:hypothetical protein PITCH_A1610006 [uncultured Desulfobacterium sp.]
MILNLGDRLHNSQFNIHNSTFNIHN